MHINYIQITNHLLHMMIHIIKIGKELVLRYFNFHLYT